MSVENWILSFVLRVAESTSLFCEPTTNRLDAEYFCGRMKSMHKDIKEVAVKIMRIKKNCRFNMPKKRSIFSETMFMIAFFPN